MEYAKLPKRFVDIGNLMKNYGKTPDEEIKSLLNSISLLVMIHKKVRTNFGIYEISEAQLNIVKLELRNYSFTFNPSTRKYRKDVNPYRLINLLIKSQSPFYIKPDVGEIFDQMTVKEKKRTRAVCINLNSGLPLRNSKDGKFIVQCILFE